LAGKRSHLNDLVQRSLEQVGLWDLLKDELERDAMSLSLGEQQRLCLARVLAVAPQVILMDEPASALDPIATLHLEDLIHTLKENYTIIIVTHNMQQAARVSDFTGLFWLGELIEFSETNKMFTHPDKPITEDYITGRMG
jgi:phosphate transport system ATP-binding protein